MQVRNHTAELCFNVDIITHIVDVQFNADMKQHHMLAGYVCCISACFISILKYRTACDKLVDAALGKAI